MVSIVLELLDILKTYGWKGLILIIAIFVIYKITSDLAASIVEKIKILLFHKRQERLCMHAFFNSINYILDVEIHTLNIFPAQPVRRALTKDLIVCSLTSMLEVATKMIKTTNKKWSGREWAHHVHNMLNDMDSLFLNKCMIKGIPRPVYIKYLEWYLIRINHLRTTVDHIAISKLSPTPASKTFTLLMLFNLFVTTMMGDCETAVYELNGDITGLIYQGGVIEPLSDK